MERKEVGIVVAGENTPTTSRFSFAVAKDGSVTKGSFVLVNSVQGCVIARVVELLARNPYVSNPNYVIDVFSVERKDEQLPVEEWHVVTADAEIVGVIDEQKSSVRRCLQPPLPGNRVFLADPESIKLVLGLDDSGLWLGSVMGHEVEAKLNLSRFLGKHLAILAMSGAGKSYTVSVLMEELLDRKLEDGTTSIVIIDPHGEYRIYADDERYARKVHVFTTSEIKFSIAEVLTHTALRFMFPSVNKRIRDNLIKLIILTKQEMNERGPVSFDHLRERLERLDGIKESEREQMADMLNDLEAMGIFGRASSPTLTDMKLGHAYIYDLSGTSSMRKRQMIVMLLANHLLLYRQKELIPPTLLVIEEAHNFAPSKESKYEAMARDIIEKIAREGRKFFLPLCLVSQRPFYLSPTALSQCNTQIIMRITNPYDLKHISETSENLSREIMNNITTFREGECIIVGEATKIPAFVKIRKRRCKARAAHEHGLEAVSRMWAREDAKKKQDLKEFI